MEFGEVRSPIKANLRAPRIPSRRTLPAHQSPSNKAADLGFCPVGASPVPDPECALRRRTNRHRFLNRESQVRFLPGALAECPGHAPNPRIGA